ncbi:MAG: biotin transporter BioY, partial [Ignavibacteriales bacterium]|nr:biotin transporter BioY [Ignavibacteriales bacterium]
MSEAKSVSTSKYFSLANASTTAQAFWIGTFAILVAVGAQIEIPHQPVPYTFQTFFVLLSGALLGRRNGFLSMMTYLAMGAIGLPIFSGGGFGFARLIGPT